MFDGRGLVCLMAGAAALHQAVVDSICSCCGWRGCFAQLLQVAVKLYKAFANGNVAIQSKTRMARKSTQLYFRSFSRLALSVRHLAPTHLSSPSASPRHFSHSHKPVEEPKTSAQRGTILDVGKTFEVQSPRLVLFVRQPLTRAAGSCAQSAAQASDWLLFTFFHGGRYHDGDVSGVAKAVR